MDEDLIITGLHKGDKDAFKAIYDRWFTQLLLFARKLIGSEEDALDIATDAYAKVWERHTQFESISHLRAFLYTATRNSCISYRRSLKIRQKYTKEVVSLSKEAEDVIERYSIEAALLERLYAIIDQLPDKQREVFTLRYVEGKRNTEIAELLQLSEKTVYSHCEQVVKKLRKVFTKQELLLLLFLISQVCKK